MKTFDTSLSTWMMLTLIAGMMFFSASVQAEDGQALARTCTVCHGAEGISGNSLWPNLAGQKKEYLATQIKAFREGYRTEPTMQVFVQHLSDAQVEALAVYFAGLSTTTPGHSAAVERVNSKGANVRALCISCHGVAGLTVNQQWPNLAGQKKEYLQKQLHAFRDGTREGPLMNVIAAELTAQQIADVAEYYSQQPH